MLNKKKIDGFRKKYLKQTSSEIEIANQNWQNLIRQVNEPFDGINRFPAWVDVLSEFPGMWSRGFIFQGMENYSLERFVKHLAVINGAFLYCRYLDQILPKQNPNLHYGKSSHFGESLLYLHASGHSDLACEEVEFSFSDKRSPRIITEARVISTGTGRIGSPFCFRWKIPAG